MDVLHKASPITPRPPTFHLPETHLYLLSADGSLPVVFIDVDLYLSQVFHFHFNGIPGESEGLWLIYNFWSHLSRIVKGLKLKAYQEDIGKSQDDKASHSFSHHKELISKPWIMYVSFLIPKFTDLSKSVGPQKPRLFLIVEHILLLLSLSFHTHESGSSAISTWQTFDEGWEP